VSDSPELDAADLAGQTLDRYALLERIGAGGMGAVYEAEHTHLRKRVAVKLLRSDLAEDPAFRRRFLREARAASAVDHPNVVAISDFGETDEGHVFLVMERLAGRDLRQLLETEQSLPWSRTRNILLQVTAALQAAHERDIVHRDVKPSNVFLVDRPGEPDEDVVKVLDFGIAKLMGHGDESSAELTAPKQVVGTVGYISPEMAMGVKDEPRSDVYAVGVMMFRMLTGALPYREGNALAILAQHIHAPIPSARDVESTVPEVAEAIIERAMAKEPDERFASMAELRVALASTDVDGGTAERTEALPAMGIGEASDGVVERTDVVELGAPSDARAGDAPARRRWGLAVLAVGAIALGIVGVTAMRSGEPPTPAAVVSPKPSTPAESQPSEPVPAQPDRVSAPVIVPGSSGDVEAAADDGGTSTGAPASTTTAAENEPVSPPPDESSPSAATAKKPPRKPRSDRDVVTSLIAKIERRCGGTLAGKVRVEGMISAGGRVESMLVTPPDGLGDCTRLVKAARFDPDPGARAMPRFSVEP